MPHNDFFTCKQFSASRHLCDFQTVKPVFAELRPQPTCYANPTSQRWTKRTKWEIWFVPLDESRLVLNWPGVSMIMNVWSTALASKRCLKKKQKLTAIEIGQDFGIIRCLPCQLSIWSSWSLYNCETSRDCKVTALQTHNGNFDTHITVTSFAVRRHFCCHVFSLTVRGWSHTRILVKLLGEPQLLIWKWYALQPSSIIRDWR